MSQKMLLSKVLMLIVLVFSNSFFLFSAELPNGLPLFWWKEGDFINFGDHISLKIVERIVGEPLSFYNKKKPGQIKKLLALGSIYYFANEGDVVWGSGINGKKPNKSDYEFNFLDIRAVRGPITRHFLYDNFGLKAPEIYGDPALLFPYLFPEFKKSEHPKNDYLVIVHYLDVKYFDDLSDPKYILATEPWDIILKAILNSKFVISTSLHGVVLAEAYGIPARYLRVCESEPLLKFYDYYWGSGRSEFTYATSIKEALIMGGSPKINCDLELLYNAFPFEFWPGRNFPKINFQKGV